LSFNQGRCESAEADHQSVGAPDLNVVAVHKLLCLGYGFAVVTTNKRFEPYEVSVQSNLICAIFLHLDSIHWSQFITKKLGDFGRPERVIALAIQALELPAAGFTEQKSHWLATLRADRGRGVLWHGRSRGIRREHYRTLCHRLMPKAGR
jgi:hypothetical protein